jgi:TupA-like ATPgrasp
MLRRFLPDRMIIEREFAAVFGHKPDLSQPRSLNEKLQWLKLYDHRPLLTQITDKYAVRQYVTERVGPEVLNQLCGVWTSADAIDQDALPSQFILKATHGCGWNWICRDKRTFDWSAVQRQLNTWLNASFYSSHREWAYKNIPPRIICECLLEDENRHSPHDYKFFCFDGEPRLIQVDVDRFGDHRRNYYDLDWAKLPLLSGNPNYPGEISRPGNLDEMLFIVRRLTRGLPFCRADLYSIGNRIIFGELTLYSGAGLVKWEPESFDYLLGDYLRLPGRPDDVASLAAKE